MTDIAEPALPISSPEAVPEEPTPMSTTAQSKPRKVILLTEFLADLPARLRLATYRTVVAAVKAGELPGFVHPSDKGDLEVVNGNNKTVVHQYAHVLLKNTAELQAQLDALCLTALNSELIRSHGRAMSVAEMLDMGDALDFDAITAAIHKAESWSKGQKKKADQAKTKRTRT